MIVLDANILVAAVLGRQVPRVLTAAHARGVALAVTEVQILEAAQVLIDKIGLTEAEARKGLEAVTALVMPLSQEFCAAMKAPARRRLHERAQSDWPVLAAALAAEGAIWSHDRDFFGVGVPVWSSRNMAYAG
ncbi:MAG: nucleotide-binding protein [Alphaproteobacteria bacterium]|nr:nucleotide-binding protein [Alphaproteobacteria bacterium]